MIKGVVAFKMCKDGNVSCSLHIGKIKSEKTAMNKAQLKGGDGQNKDTFLKQWCIKIMVEKLEIVTDYSFSK